MPFRLDLALWGACLAITLGRRFNIILHSDAKYLRMKYETWAIDYIFMGSMLCLCDGYLSQNFTFKTIVGHQVVNSCLVVAIDLLKAVLYVNLLPKAKTDHLKHLGQSMWDAISTVRGIQDNFRFIGKLMTLQGIAWGDWDEGKAVRRSVRHNVWYFFYIGLVSIPLTAALYVHVGLFTCEPLNENIFVLGEGEWYECQVSRFLQVYLEYLTMAFIKDCISMNLLHQIMHSKYYHHHKTHHLPMRELSVVNLFYIDVLDLIVEDGVGPLLMIGLKILLGGNATVHYMSFYLMMVSDEMVHSLDPYTAVFWNPLLDNVMRGSLSHNLHHAINCGHYTIWPLHHFVGVETPNHKSGKALDGFEVDIKDYNKVFETRFPEYL